MRIPVWMYASLICMANNPDMQELQEEVRHVPKGPLTVVVPDKDDPWRGHCPLHDLSFDDVCYCCVADAEYAECAELWQDDDDDA